MQQAVVFVHGIGEQKPMETSRRFVAAILPKPKSGEKYWSQPDHLSEILELRRLSSRSRPNTHFYEYYWAHHVHGTNVSHLARWLASLIIRRKRNVPAHLRGIWRISRLTTIAIIVFLGLGGYELWMPVKTGSPRWLIVAALLAMIQYVSIRYLGDAARYLSPTPENISTRKKIRSEGMRLLRELHKKKRGYDRIIIVGHSLGSVIGYDLITRLWQEYNTIHKDPKRMKQPAIKGISDIGEKLNDISADETSAGRNNDTEPEYDKVYDKFRTTQIDLWHEQKAATNPWRITDFITLGSPLAHAQLLLADSMDDFDRRTFQRELPKCPPVLDGKTYFYWKRPPYLRNGKKISLGTLHHAAPFAVTRWTNLYFPAIGGIFGDLVGGPLQKVFGNGIKDIPVTTKRWWGLARFTPISHTMYWSPHEQDHTLAEGDGRKITSRKIQSPKKFALPTLRESLELRQLGKFSVTKVSTDITD